MEYTKGEWKYNARELAYQEEDAPECYRGAIIGGEEGLILAVMISDCLEKEVKANAQLIAAAPNLYEACHLVARAAVDDGVDMSEAIDACLLALTKAREK